MHMYMCTQSKIWRVLSELICICCGFVLVCHFFFLEVVLLDFSVKTLTAIGQEENAAMY